MATKSPHNSTSSATSSVGQSIVILDFGAQYSQLIARRIREQNVFSVVLPCTAKLDEVKSYAPAGIVLSGAPWSVYDKDAPPADSRVFELGVPVLGICYGLQFMVHTLGGKVRPAEKREYGRAEIDIVSDSVLFQGLAKKLAVWMSHGDEALELPPGFELMAKTHYAVAGIQNTAKQLVRGSVPSGSAPHAAGHADAAQFCFRDLRRQAQRGRRSALSIRRSSR